MKKVLLKDHKEWMLTYNKHGDLMLKTSDKQYWNETDWVRFHHQYPIMIFEDNELYGGTRAHMGGDMTRYECLMQELGGNTSLFKYPHLKWKANEI